MTIPLVLVAMLGLAWAGPAFAVRYASHASPVRAESNSDDGNDWFHGRMTVVDFTSLRNRYHYRDSAPGGNKAYVTTRWFYYTTCTNGLPCWDGPSGDRSSPTDSGEWFWASDYDDLENSADRGRGSSEVCEEQSFEPDDCSKLVTITLDY
ncbi:MAG: hypothetical protein ACRCYU_21930 [Nocardioides sp.]